jgi:hypothetical protein
MVDAGEDACGTVGPRVKDGADDGDRKNSVLLGANEGIFDRISDDCSTVKAATGGVSLLL